MDDVDVAVDVVVDVDDVIGEDGKDENGLTAPAPPPNPYKLYRAESWKKLNKIIFKATD